MFSGIPASPGIWTMLRSMPDTAIAPRAVIRKVKNETRVKLRDEVVCSLTRLWDYNVAQKHGSLLWHETRSL